jgi:hypothetical protein
MVRLGKLKNLIFVFLSLVTVFITSEAVAENLALMRRWVVFPYDSDSPALKNAAENAWWKTRERLTLSKKYLVASRQFLLQKDVFQPRKTLSPDDVKLLAHLLDADVNLGQNGQLFWSKRLSFHPSLKATDQLELVSDKLTQDLLSQIPYQGFVVTDPLVGKTVFDEDSKKHVVVDTGTTDDVQEGMDIQWIQVLLPEASEIKEGVPLLSQVKIDVIADGKISKIKKGVFVAQIDRVKSIDLINERTLAVIPKLANKLGENYLGSEIAKEKTSPEVLPTIINPIAPESQGARRGTLVFGSLVSVLGLLLLGL